MKSHLSTHVLTSLPSHLSAECARHTWFQVCLWCASVTWLWMCPVLALPFSLLLIIDFIINISTIKNYSPAKRSYKLGLILSLLVLMFFIENFLCLLYSDHLPLTCNSFSIPWTPSQIHDLFLINTYIYIHICVLGGCGHILGECGCVLVS